MGDDAHSPCGRAKVRLLSIASTDLEPTWRVRENNHLRRRSQRVLKRRAGGKVGGQGIQNRDDERDGQTRRLLTKDTRAQSPAARAREVESERYDARANEAEVR